MVGRLVFIVAVKLQPWGTALGVGGVVSDEIMPLAVCLVITVVGPLDGLFGRTSPIRLFARLGKQCVVTLHDPLTSLSGLRLPCLCLSPLPSLPIRCLRLSISGPLPGLRQNEATRSDTRRRRRCDLWTVLRLGVVPLGPSLLGALGARQLLVILRKASIPLRSCSPTRLSLQVPRPLVTALGVTVLGTAAPTFVVFLIALAVLGPKTN